jgi:hypothetical protein
MTRGTLVWPSPVDRSNRNKTRHRKIISIKITTATRISTTTTTTTKTTKKPIHSTTRVVIYFILRTSLKLLTVNHQTKLNII